MINARGRKRVQALTNPRHPSSSTKIVTKGVLHTCSRPSNPSDNPARKRPSHTHCENALIFAFAKHLGIPIVRTFSGTCHICYENRFVPFGGYADSTSAPGRFVSVI